MINDKLRVSIHRLYYQISTIQRDKYSEFDASLKELGQRGISENEVDSIFEEQETTYEKREMAAAISITFSGMCLEAFFFDYAAEHFGDSYAKNHLDKLDLISKLIVVPRLVTGATIDKSGQAYEAVKKLSADRNFLVHFKSKAFAFSELDNMSNFHEKLNNRLREGMVNGVKAVELIMKELDRLHGRDNYFHNTVCT